MKLRTLARAFAAAAVVAASAGGALRANGAEFFESQNDGRVVVYYFGNVKDSQGNALDKFRIVVQVRNVLNAPKTGPLTFTIASNLPGHFKTVDVGLAIEGMGGKVDPSQISVTIEKPGYKMTKAPAVPNKMGGVDLGTFILDPVPGGAAKK